MLVLFRFVHSFDRNISIDMTDVNLLDGDELVNPLSN